MYVLYEVLLGLVLVLALPYFLITGALRRKYFSNLADRFGRYSHPRETHDLWIHAVSVGETIAARPLVAEILRRAPQTRIVFTTTTLTGQAQARKLFPAATVTYFPFDFSPVVRRFLDHHQPRVFVAMETEIWPTVTRLSRRRGIRMLLANARLSDRSYPRYRAARWFVAPLLNAYDAICAREETDRDRFVALGADEAKVDVSGNVKFDFELDETPLAGEAELLRIAGSRPVVVFGSTMEGEDEELLPVIRHLTAERRAFLILAPRKPERFDAVANLLSDHRLPSVRRSRMTDGAAGDGADVLLLDTFGELAKVYRHAVAAFVGGTLVPIGGHNPIEPAAAGVPVCFGPSMSNFREIAESFLRSGAAVQVRTAAEVGEFIERMIDHPDEQRELGGRALQTVRENRGAAARVAERVVELLR